jgi:hypothetical protein
MSLHPKFDANSSCENCAAFELFPLDGDTVSGQCHRHAPKPFQPTETFGPRSETPQNTTQAQKGSFASIDWPTVNNCSAMFCCEWLPKPPETEAKP